MSESVRMSSGPTGTASYASLKGLGEGLSKSIPGGVGTAPGSPTGGYNQGLGQGGTGGPSPGTGDPGAPGDDQGGIGGGTDGGADPFAPAPVDPAYWRGYWADQGIDWNLDPGVAQIKAQEQEFMGRDIDMNSFDYGEIEYGNNLVPIENTNFEKLNVDLQDQLYRQMVMQDYYDLGVENSPAWHWGVYGYGNNGGLSVYQPEAYTLSGGEALFGGKWAGSGVDYGSGYTGGGDGEMDFGNDLFADGGLVGPPGGGEMGPYENNLVKGAILALDPESPVSDEDRQIILAEFEKTFGEGSIDELMGTLQGQGEAGGEVVGPGTGTSDSVPALVNGQRPAALSDGEFVITADDVQNTFGGGDRDRGVQNIEQLIGNARASGGIMQGVE